MPVLAGEQQSELQARFERVLRPYSHTAWEHRMRNFIVFVLTCVFCTPSVAQEVVDAPKSLVGFLKPGMHLGLISYFPESDRITLRIYSEEDQAIAIDSQELSLEQLCAKYEKVASELERTRKEILTSLESNPPQLPRAKRTESQALVCG